MDESKQDKPDLSSAGEPAKRNPPTIDLEASHVSEAAPVLDADVTAASEDHSETSASPDHSESAAHSGAAEPVHPKPSRAPSLVASAMMGAVTALLVVGVTKLANWPPAPVAPPQTNAADKSDITALGARLAKIESETGKPVPSPQPVADPTVTARLGALEKSLSALRDDIAAARGQSEKAVAALNEIKSAAPPPTPQATDDPKLRNVAAVTLLDSSVRQGEPYAAALAIVRASADDATALKPLDAFAATGLPSANALCRELLALLPQLAPKPETPAAPSGIVERLQQSATKLVRIQRTDAATSGNAGILARTTAAAQRNDVTEAKRELLTLPAADRTPAQAWIAKVDAREAALNASRQVAADTMTALSKPAR